jgi:hypothetical protein
VSKRQIIKTRPQRPYVIARIVLLLALAAALAAGIIRLEHAPRPAHGAAAHSADRLQEAVLAAHEGRTVAVSTEPCSS